MPEPQPQPQPDVESAAQQRRHLRRILIAFFVVVVLLPIAGLGGALYWLLVPLVLVAAFALREGLRLRRLVRRDGAARAR